MNRNYSNFNKFMGYNLLYQIELKIINKEKPNINFFIYYYNFKIVFKTEINIPLITIVTNRMAIYLLFGFL